MLLDPASCRGLAGARTKSVLSTQGQSSSGASPGARRVEVRLSGEDGKTAPSVGLGHAACSSLVMSMHPPVLCPVRTPRTLLDFPFPESARPAGSLDLQLQTPCSPAGPRDRLRTRREHVEALLDEAASRPPSVLIVCIRRLPNCVVLLRRWNYRQETALGLMSGPAPAPSVGSGSLSDNDAACMFPGSECVSRTLAPDRGGHASRSGVPGLCPTSSSSPMQSEGSSSLRTLGLPSCLFLRSPVYPGFPWRPHPRPRPHLFLP